MSISTNNNADNHNSLLQMPPHQSPVEENKKWRCTKLSKGGNDLLSVSPEQMKFSEVDIRRRLSENEEMNPKPCTTKISSTHPRICRSYFVRLAEESPKRNSAEHSDSSTYDSMNCRETDICQDSSDTDSNSSCSSDPFGTIKVVEYEVASTSNSEDLFTNDSSSGTDDMLIAVASVICDSARLSSDFADTEEGSSDTGSMYDSEMSSADYWKCVKCKNKNNNPMFRYCEKCYQIRKTHFPPRPRLRKSRSALKQGKLIGLSSLQRAATTSLIEESLQRGREDVSEKMKLRHTSLSSPSSPLLQKEPFIGRRVGISQKQLRNSAESSTDDDETTSKFYKFMNNTSSENYIKRTDSGSHFSSSSMVKKCNVQQSPQNLQMCTKRKLSTGPQSANKSISKKICFNKDLISPLLASETENETDFVLSQSLCGSSTQGTQKDSGFSSAPSSQERKSSSDQPNDEYEDCISHPSNGDDASDTVSDELNDSDVDEIILQDKYAHIDDDTCLPIQNSNKGISVSLLPPILDTNTALPLLQTISDCSDTYSSIASPSNQDSLKTSSAKQPEKFDRNFGDITSYGSCMTCLTEPKNGVFVHSRFLHLCCCYKCAVKIWNKNKKCPICNCAVKNVMKLFVH